MNIITEWRKHPKRSMSQTELAALLGVTQSYVSALETGKRKPAPSVLKRLREVTKIPAAKLKQHLDAE